MVATKAWLSSTVEQHIRREILNRPEVETGGLLLGYWSATDVVIADAIGPGPGAAHAPTRFKPDARWQEQELARRYSASSRRHTYLGDWHVHPTGSPSLSRTDRKTLRRIATDPAARAPQPLMAIVAPDAAGEVVVWQHCGRWHRPTRLVMSTYWD